MKASGRKFGVRPVAVIQSQLPCVEKPEASLMPLSCVLNGERPEQNVFPPSKVYPDRRICPWWTSKRAEQPDVMAAMRDAAPSSLELILAGYASGTLPPALHALVGAHLELSAKNRPFVTSLEESLGRTVGRETPCSIRAREARLNAIFACGDGSNQRRSASPDDPKALVHFLGKPIDAMEFRTILPGVLECRLPSRSGHEAVLYKIRAGQKMPRHSHVGSEITLVLRGGFSDETGHFRRGDVAVADEHLDHVPVADDGEECVCFAVLDAPLRLTGRIGRWLNAPIRLLGKLDVRKSGRTN